MGDDDVGVRVGRGYPTGQLAKAFATAVSHEDPDTRRRAEERLSRWQSVLSGMADGRLEIGSRTPVADLPAWVTPEVMRGGFATGAALGGGRLGLNDRALARRAGVLPEPAALFAYYLTDAGLAELHARLDDGRYEIQVPEQAALLTVAWLLRQGDRAAALGLLDTIEPFAHRLRFWPGRGEGDAPSDPAVVWRSTVGDVRAAVAERRPNDQIEAMREALTVWNRFGDELLALWLETVRDGRVAAYTPPDWTERAGALLDVYQTLTATHTRCSKHRKPKENLAILRTALEEAVTGRELSPRERGRLQRAVDDMVRRRGAPGSAPHATLRARQIEDASRPTHHALAQVVVARLSGLPQEVGVRSTDALTRPVDPDEAAATEVPPGSEIPTSIRRVVDRALAGSIEELLARGGVPSAEVLAGLVPQVAAMASGVAYPDKALRGLMAANYAAFRRRRSLLLLNLEHQVRLDELPWVRAVARYRRADHETAAGLRAALVRLGELAIEAFPATVMPNRMVTELAFLARDAGLDLPFVEELAADIFMGSFSAKFLRAAQLAARLLVGTLYERYYALDPQVVLAIDDVVKPPGFPATSERFAALCSERAGGRRWPRYVAVNGAIIEQAQILTTHNLAVLAGPLEVRPRVGWSALADRTFEAVCRSMARVHRNPSPLRMIKDAAYAWRQMIFYLSLAGPGEQSRFVGSAVAYLETRADHVKIRLAPALAGLAHVVDGGTFDEQGRAAEGHRFLGWAVGQHWMLR